MSLICNINISGDAVIRSDVGEFSLGRQSKSILSTIKVSSVQGSSTEASADVRFIADGVSFAKFYKFTPDMNGPNFVKQAYEYLKTLPEFEDAKDN